jgi:DNA polymerase elongation subunit (family B)
MKKPVQTRSVEQEKTDVVDDIIALDDTTKGILPLEIYKLVERRREVKKLIKEAKNLSEEQLVQVKTLFFRINKIRRSIFSTIFVKKLIN